MRVLLSWHTNVEELVWKPLDRRATNLASYSQVSKKNTTQSKPKARDRKRSLDIRLADRPYNAKNQTKGK
jgi:hypothetical protein